MKMNKILSAGLALIMIALTVGTVSANKPLRVAEELAIAATMDNTLYESEDGALSNGAGAHFFVGKTAAGDLRRGLIFFSLTESIPDGAIIVDAELKLHASRTRAGEQSVSLHKVLSNWGEGTSDASGQEGQGAPATVGDATWIHTFWDTDRWSDGGGQPGGHFLPTASSVSEVAGTGDYSWTGSTMVKDVQSWIDNPDQNFGWILLGEEETSGTAVRFDSRQHNVQQVRPQLVIEYLVPSENVYLPYINVN